MLPSRERECLLSCCNNTNTKTYKININYMYSRSPYRRGNGEVQTVLGRQTPAEGDNGGEWPRRSQKHHLCGMGDVLLVVTTTPLLSYYILYSLVVDGVVRCGLIYVYYTTFPSLKKLPCSHIIQFNSSISGGGGGEKALF